MHECKQDLFETLNLENKHLFEKKLAANVFWCKSENVQK